MHARWNTFRGGRRRALQGGVVLAVCLAAAWLAPGGRAQESSQEQSAGSSVGVTSQRLPRDTQTITPESLLEAAARAAGLTGKPAEKQEAEGEAAAGEGQLPAPGAPRPNPFTQGAPTPAPQSLLVPANPSDPEKVVLQENDGLVSLMVREGSLRQVIAMIADTQKLNIVFADPAETLVTASFERQPWQTVLDALLSASGHTWTTREEVIFIYSIDNAKFIPPGADGRRVEVFELDFASAVDIDQTIKGGLLSPAGDSWLVEINKADNRRTREAVAVMDYPAYLTRVSDYIGQADQPPRQVFIEAHILQVELKDDCRNGVNFENLISMKSANVTLRSVGLANAGAASAFFIEPDGVGLDGLIELLKTTTDAKTLASPKIHGVSGQESHIQIGGQLGYRVTTTTQTSTLESVQFLDVGVVLRVTPRITRDGRVLMRIYPKVSTGQVDPDTGLPSEETTEVETDVLLCSGQGIVIGGLIQEVDNNIQSKIPLLGEIPYLGVLFSRRQVTKSRQEIIVTLQPHVLPYEPIVQARLEHDFVRTTEPLTYGAVHEFPRPYEPQMPDQFHHYHKHKKKVLPNHWIEDPYAPTELLTLPPVDEFELQYPEAVAAPAPRASRDVAVERIPTPVEDPQPGPILNKELYSR